MFGFLGFAGRAAPSRLVAVVVGHGLIVEGMDWDRQGNKVEPRTNAVDLMTSQDAGGSVLKTCGCSDVFWGLFSLTLRTEMRCDLDVRLWGDGGESAGVGWLTLRG